ncbi:MAG: hypothetical protein ACREDV_09980 [Methylocella sp.]
MKSDTLHIVTAIANPIMWKSRVLLARAAIVDWLREANVHVTIVEVAHGARGFELADLGENARVTHVPVRATTLCWSKENCLNIGISRLPHDARYIGTFDADIHFRKPGWAAEAIQALQIYPVVQPWKTAYDLGPNDDHLQAHKSFTSCFHKDDPVAPKGTKFWKHCGGCYDYPHSGFAWCWVREILDKIGGLFELGGMGSGDHHMALALAGLADASFPAGIGGAYRDAVKIWEARALVHVNRKLGYVPGTIEHRWHGDKTRRAYVSRWDMFIKHQFNPYADLKRNSHGVLEFSGNKPDLERTFDNYLRNREEDSNLIG